MSKRLYAEFNTKIENMPTPTISVEELARRFPERTKDPSHGLCIVIYGNEFNPDWEGMLPVDVIHTDFGNPTKPVTLVPLKGEKPAEERSQMLKRGAKGRHNLTAAKWSTKDEERLLKRIDELNGSIDARCQELTKEFPGRSKESIHQKYVKLKPVKKEAKKHEKPAETCPKCGLAPDLCMCAEREKEEERRSKKKESKKTPIVRTDLAEALAALVEAVGPENIQFSISIQVGSKAPT